MSRAIAETLRKGVAHMDRVGWWQGTAYAPSGRRTRRTPEVIAELPCCASAAIEQATGFRVGEHGPTDVSPLFCETTDALERALGLQTNHLNKWNDAPGQTYANVRQTMLRVADEMEGA